MAQIKNIYGKAFSDRYFLEINIVPNIKGIKPSIGPLVKRRKDANKDIITIPTASMYKDHDNNTTA